MSLLRSTALTFSALWAIARPGAALPQIDHVGLECIAPGKFAVVLSGIDPTDEIQTAKVYFRSELYPDFYYVEMTREGERFVGVLPQVAPETPRVIYYVEAVDLVFDGTRSPEFDPVVDDCDDDPAAAYFTGETPAIVVGATTAGGAALPPGFSTVGIVGTITAAGISSGVGGGVGAGAAVAAAAGAAGVAGAVVATSPAEETTTSSVPAAPPSSIPTTTTSAPPAPTTTVPGPTTTVASSTTTTTVGPGSTTTTVPAGTTTSSAASTTTTSSPPTTTTSTPPSTTTVPLDVSCFTVQGVGECRVRLDASCVPEPVTRYEWELDLDGKWEYVHIPSGNATFTHNWGGSDCDDDGTVLRFRLTVHRGASSSSAEKSAFVEGKDDLREPPVVPAVELQLGTRLELPGQGSRGRVLVGGRLERSIASGEPASIRVQVTEGQGSVEVEAVVGRASGEPGAWTFEVPRPAALRVLDGKVIVVGPDRVAFRLSGQPNERVRFQISLAP